MAIEERGGGVAVLLTGLDTVRPVPASSALAELGSALHVLHGPDHHGQQGWADGIRASMSPRLDEQTAAWAWATHAIRARAFVTVPPTAGDLTAEIAWLRTLPPRELARGLLRPLSASGDVQVAARWARARGDATAVLVDRLVSEPVAAAADFVDFVTGCVEEWFGDEWTRLRQVLSARARLLSDRIEQLGAAAALTGLDPSITAVGVGTVSIAKVQSRRHDLSGRGLTVVASAFVSPHLYVADIPGEPLLLIHPVDPARGPVPSAAQLLRRLDAAANPGRLEVARAIATEPRTAGEIADLWGMDSTLVTRHLRALSAAGLARGTRRGRFVQYRLDLEAVRGIGGDLLMLLLR